MVDFGKGCLPRESKVGDGAFPVFKDEWLILPKDWQFYDEVSLVPHVKHIINQARQGSCNPAMSCGVTSLVRNMAGLDDIVFAQAGLYAFDRILDSGELVPRRSDSGMALDTSLKLLQKVGCSPKEWNGKPWINQYDWQGYRVGNWPSNWREVASRFTMKEWYDCPTLEHIISARCLGVPVGYGCKGHAVARIAKDKDLNSWDYSWGDNGIGEWATYREIEKQIAMYGAWAYITTNDPPNDGDI